MNVNHPDYVPSVFPAVYRTSASNSKEKRAERLDRAWKRAEDKEATEKRAEEQERRCEYEEATIHSEETPQRERNEEEEALECAGAMILLSTETVSENKQHKQTPLNL